MLFKAIAIGDDGAMTTASSREKTAAKFSNFAELDLNALPSTRRGEAGIHRVRQVVATAETLRGYGHIVTDFATGAVTIVTWPQPGWRPIVAGTGNEGGI